MSLAYHNIHPLPTCGLGTRRTAFVGLAPAYHRGCAIDDGKIGGLIDNRLSLGNIAVVIVHVPAIIRLSRLVVPLQLLVFTNSRFVDIDCFRAPAVLCCCIETGCVSE